MEKHGFTMGIQPPRSGNQFRQSILNMARNHQRNGTAMQFANSNDTVSRSSSGLVLLNIPDTLSYTSAQGKIDGWDIIEQTIQSYQNGTYRPIKDYGIDDAREPWRRMGQNRLHEFLDRIAYFNAEARRELGDDRFVGDARDFYNMFRNNKGECLIQEHFTVATTPLNNAHQIAAPRPQPVATQQSPYAMSPTTASQPSATPRPQSAVTRPQPQVIASQPSSTITPQPEPGAIFQPRSTVVPNPLPATPTVPRTWQNPHRAR